MSLMSSVHIDRATKASARNCAGWYVKLEDDYGAEFSMMLPYGTSEENANKLADLMNTLISDAKREANKLLEAAE